MGTTGECLDKRGQLVSVKTVGTTGECLYRGGQPVSVYTEGDNW